MGHSNSPIARSQTGARIGLRALKSCGLSGGPSPKRSSVVCVFLTEEHHPPRSQQQSARFRAGKDLLAAHFHFLLGGRRSPAPS